MKRVSLRAIEIREEKQMGVNLVLGTMTFGQQAFLNESTEMVRYFLDQGHSELDTAYVYNEAYLICF